MYIYFDTNGTIKEIVNDKSIRNGSNEANKIYCYLEGEPEIDDIWYLQKLPSGELSNEVSFKNSTIIKAIPYDAKRDMKYFKDFEQYTFYVFTLNTFLTSQKGLNIATIRVSVDNTIWALGELTFNVQENVINVDNGITQSQYDYLLLAYASRTLNKQVGRNLNDLIDDKIEAKIGDLASGSPKVFDTEYNIEHMQDDEGIAVATDTGYIYVWNDTQRQYINTGLLYVGDISLYYTKTETDTLLNAKVDDVYKCIGKIYANKDVSYSTSSVYPSSSFDEPIPSGTNILIHYNLPVDSNGHQFSFKDVNNQNVNTYIYYNNEGWLLLKLDVDVYGIGFWVNSLTSGSGYYKVYTYKDLLNQDLENDENVLYEGKITTTFPSYTLYRPILAHTKIILNWDDMAIDGNNHGMSFVDANNNRVLTYVFIENNGSKEFEFDVDIVKLEFGMNNYSSHNCLWNISKYTINGNIQNNINKIDIISDLLFKTPKNKPIIVDTDFSADVDDCVALRLLCWGADMKLVNIRGVVADNYTNIVAPTIDGFMKYYGHPTDVGYDVTKFNQKTSSYQNWIYNNTTHKYDTTDEYPDAVKVYRKQLAKTQDKITIVSLGFLTNLRRLLESQSDGYSSLNGVELVTEKVECIYIMGGIINTSLTLEDEYNFKYDIDSAKYVIDNCPVPIVYFSQNIGLVKCGQNLKDIYASINDDLVYHAYYDYTQAQGEDVINNGRYCWDGMLMYLAMIGDLDYCGYRVIKGSYHIDNNNYGIFTLSSNGNQYNLIKIKNTEFYQKQINTKIF